MKAKRNTRKVSYNDHYAGSEESDPETNGVPARKGRRPGKEPVDEEYGAQLEEEENEPQPKRSRQGRISGRQTQAFTNTPGLEAGPSAPVVKQEPRQGGRSAQQQGRPGAAAVSRQALSAMHERMAEYKRLADEAQARFRGGISRQEMDNLVRLVMRHMLFMNTEKPGIPVSRAEVTKLVSENTVKKHNMSSMIISYAQYKMLEVFGLEMREITKAPQKGAHKAMAVPGEGSKHFTLRSVVPPTLLADVVQDRKDDSVRGFATVLLTLLELSGGKLTAAELWPLLEDLGMEEQQQHPRLGKPADLLEQLARRRYVNVERQQGPDGEVRIYSIAENALDELGKDNLKDFYEEEFALEENGTAAA